MEKHSDLKIEQLDPQLSAEKEAGSSDANKANSHLSRKETRQIVTPYAFFVADDLLGTPLAGPFRRGFGMLIDLFLVSLLTQVSSLVLATIAAWTFFKAGNRLKTKKRFNAVRILLRLLVAMLLFVVATSLFDKFNDNSAADDVENSPSAIIENDNIEDSIELIALTAKYLMDAKATKQQIREGECEPALQCMQSLGEDLIEDVVTLGLDKNTIDEIVEGFTSGVADSINSDEEQQLKAYLKQFLDTQTLVQTNAGIAAELTEPAVVELEPAVVEAGDSTSDGTNIEKPKGLFARLKEWIEELGLGLGWAAFYFSIFTAWWRGQTPGKRLLGMKVIKLDNKPLNLWESFGRYGGYAAGLATGLTGFLQVFWDPNRQAIQDKISETLVIDIRKPKVPFTKESAE
ncbi:MAG: RDD family protein [Paraglaciecola sp.]|uniref:RDD family protein n=1 Tax=Paraglaciecola sp. TaxID=1920173 RepID=UPI003298C164